MTLYGIYCVHSIDEIVDAISHLHLHRNIFKCEKMLSDRWSYGYKDNNLERGIAHMVLHCLIYLHDLQIKYCKSI